MKTEQGVDACINQLLKLPCFDHVILVTEITQGLSHRCFKVNTNDQIYFAKYIEKRSTAYTETILSKIAADMGISPEVYFNDDEWLITAFIDSESLTNIPTPMEAKLKIAIEAMAKYHDIGHSFERSFKQSFAQSLPMLDIELTIDKLLHVGQFSQQQREVIARIKSKLSASISVTPQVVCHGDLNFSNIILCQNKSSLAIDTSSSQPSYYYLIDFECSCLADAEFDLAMMIAVNEIPLKHLDDAVQHYNRSSKKRADIDVDLVMRYLVFSHLINGLWYYCEYCENGGRSSLIKANLQFKSVDSLAIINDSLLHEMR